MTRQNGFCQEDEKMMMSQAELAEMQKAKKKAEEDAFFNGWTAGVALIQLHFPS